jgi:hypothetical protein
VYIDSNALTLDPRSNHEAYATTKRAHELNHTVLSELSPLPRVRDALQELLRVGRRNRWAFNLLLFAVKDYDWRKPDMQSQLIRSIGMNQMQQIFHRIHVLRVI